MMHSMKLNTVPFYQIAQGEKIIELRLWDEKRQKIKEGDYITFTNADSPDEFIMVKVVALTRAESFEELFKLISPKSCGFNEGDDPCGIMEQFYSPEKQSLYGVVGISVFFLAGVGAGITPLEDDLPLLKPIRPTDTLDDTQYII